MSVRQFSGKGQCHGKGTCDLMLFKGAMLEHLMGKELDLLECPTEEKEKIRMCLFNHQAFDTYAAEGAPRRILTGSRGMFYPV